jgi:hypothetical protein
VVFSCVQAPRCSSTHNAPKTPRVRDMMHPFRARNR